MELSDRYEVLDTLGCGGMGEVYLARDRLRDRQVAVKVMTMGLETAHVRRFEREWEVLAKLSHPAIVPVLDYGQLAGGQYYFTMPFVEGCTSLKQWIKDFLGGQFRNLDPSWVVSAFGDIASALDYIHGHGITHRDVKPANILTFPTGRAMLIDFGLVGLLHSSLTASGVILGTMTYMSPELATGGEVGSSSDLFQLGLTLYEVATGVRACHIPYEYFKAMGLGKRPFPDPSCLHPYVGPELERVILKATALAARDRFRTGEEMVRALRAVPAADWPSSLDPLDLPCSLPGPSDADTGAVAMAAVEPVEHVPATVFDSPIDQLPPEFFERYEIRERLGQGTSAVVYRGVQKALNRVVAIKLFRMRSATMSDRAAIRFRREAQILARLSHPNLVKVFDLEVTPQASYIVYEHIDGEPLESTLARHGRIPVTRVVALACDLLAGLEHLHENHVIHRDLKPANIMLDTAGSVLIIDLGTAKIARALETLTCSGVALGTPDYMAPEQVTSSRVGPAADFYSLGMVLYRCLTGAVPFTGTAAQVMALKASVDVPPVESIVSLPSHVSSVVNRLLARDPLNRLQSALQARQLLAQSPVPGRIVPGSDRIPRPLSRHFSPRRRFDRWALAVGVGAAAVLVLCAAAVWLLAPSRHQITVSALEVVPRLEGVAVRFHVWPPGPATLRVATGDGPKREVRSPTDGQTHVIHVTDIPPGGSLSLQAVSHGASGPPATYRVEHAPVRGLSVSRGSMGLQIVFATPSAVRCRLQVQGLDTTTWLPWEDSESHSHRIVVPWDRMPVSWKLRLGMRQGQAEREENLILGSTARDRLLEVLADRFVDEVFSRSKKVFVPIDPEDAAAAAAVPRRAVAAFGGLTSGWVLEGLGGPDGVLDSSRVSCDRKDTFYRALAVLETANDALRLGGMPPALPVHRLYGRHFGPSIESSCPRIRWVHLELLKAPNRGLAHVLPNNAPSPSADSSVAQVTILRRAEATFEVGAPGPFRCVQLRVRARIPVGRQLCATLNGRYQLRFISPQASIGAVEMTDLYCSFDSRYLHAGRNEVTMECPAALPGMKELEARYFASLLIHESGPGLDPMFEFQSGLIGVWIDPETLAVGVLE